MSREMIPMARSEKTQFVGAQGARLAAIIDWPERAPDGYAVFAHCFTCSKDAKAAYWISRTLADLENQPQELKDHYRMIALDRIKVWMGTGEKLTPDTAGVLAFSIHSEAENSWYQLRGWLDEDEKLSMERDTEYLDIKEEEADYIAWLKKKGFLE